MSAPHTLSSTFRVGKHFRCTMTAELPTPSRIDCEWRPDLPRKLKQRDVAEYQRGRDAFFAELGRAIGLRLAVIDVGTESARLTIPSDNEPAGIA